MSNYIKYRAILNKYDSSNLPNTSVICGIICNDKDEVKFQSFVMIKDLFDSRYTNNICPGQGYDPRFYELDTKDPNMCPIIRYNHPAKHPNDLGIPVFNATWAVVKCTFTDSTNVIEYRAMRINKYRDKWYVSSTFNNQIIGIIDDKTSLNDICAEADKIWENVKIDHKEPRVTLSDN